MGSCQICGGGDDQLVEMISALREKGFGYKRVHRALREFGYRIGRNAVQDHVSHVERTVMSAIGDAEDAAEHVVSTDYFVRRGIELPPDGTRWVAATVEETGPDGQKHWLRLRPEEEETPEERIEIRQAQPVVVEAVRPQFVLVRPNEWQTWIATPDAQIGYWLHHNGAWFTTHDERCFNISHQVARLISDAGELHGWLDLGDFGDLAAPSRHHPTSKDTHVLGLNKTVQRGSEELALRRDAVGPDGEVIVLSGNHDIRLGKAAAEKMPYLVGLRRAGDDEEEFPVLTLPFLMRARDYGVEWVYSWPQGYRKLNSNLMAFHCPAYGGKALDTARKIAARVHSSVIHGHTHRREALAENIETDRGVRTLEIWSDGTFARTDGSLPSDRNTMDEYLSRLTAGGPDAKTGVLSENWGQGFSILHVETSGRERFSVERIAIWDGWAQWRGTTFVAQCDANGNPLSQESECLAS